MSFSPKQCSPGKQGLLLASFLYTVSVLDLCIGLGKEWGCVLLKEGSGLLSAHKAHAEGTQRTANIRSYCTWRNYKKIFV